MRRSTVLNESLAELHVTRGRTGTELRRCDVPGLLRFISAHEQRHQSQFSAVICGA